VAPPPKKKKNKEGEEVNEEGDDGVGLSQGTFGVADECRSRPCPHRLQVSGPHPCSTVLSLRLIGKRRTTQPK
jgi:hypothetical protein